MMKKFLSIGISILFMVWLIACERGSFVILPTTPTSTAMQPVATNAMFMGSDETSAPTVNSTFSSPLTEPQAVNLVTYIGLYDIDKQFQIQYDTSLWQLINIDIGDERSLLPILINQRDNLCQLGLLFPAGDATPLGSAHLGEFEWRIWRGNEKYVMYTTQVAEIGKIFAVTLYDDYSATDKGACQRQAEAVITTFAPIP